MIGWVVVALLALIVVSLFVISKQLGELLINQNRPHILSLEDKTEVMNRLERIQQNLETANEALDERNSNVTAQQIAEEVWMVVGYHSPLQGNKDLYNDLQSVDRTLQRLADDVRDMKITQIKKDALDKLR